MEKKLSVGLVSHSKDEESNIRKELGSFNLGNLSVCSSVLELLQKSQYQKYDFIIHLEDQKESAQNFLAVPEFLRSKKHLANIPICLMIRGGKGQTESGFFDKTVRAFPMSLGHFIPLSVMVGIVQKSEASVTKIIDENWMLQQIKDNFTESLGSFDATEPTDEERNQQYLFEKEIECRSHLFWLRASIRLIAVSPATQGAAKVAGMDVEDFVEDKVRPIAYEIEKQVEQDLISEGAIFLPYIEDLKPEARKIVLGNRKNQAKTLSHRDFKFFIELTRYL